MFLGHPAVAFAAKRFAPRTSLGWLVGAAMFLDLLWPALILTGVEKVRIEPGNTAFTPLAFDSYPFSHSLATSLGISGLMGWAYWRLTKDKTGAWVLSGCAFSHWILDCLSHRPDLPLAPGISARVGLGLWNSVTATLAVEILMFSGGVWLYWRTMQANGKSGRWSLWIFAGFLGFIYLGNAFGPPPPSVQAIAWVGLGSWLLPFWAAWVDRHRIPRP